MAWICEEAGLSVGLAGGGGEEAAEVRLKVHRARSLLQLSHSYFTPLATFHSTMSSTFAHTFTW